LNFNFQASSMQVFASLVLILMLVSSPGCQSKATSANPDGKAEGRMPRAPREAPLAPPKKDVPIDPELKYLADREISKALGSSDPIERVHALEAIRDIESTKHQDDVRSALKDPEAVVRFAAALACGELRIKEAKPALLGLKDDRSGNVRVAVRFALHRLGDKRLSHDLEHTATDSSPLVRGNTAFVLGLIGEPSAITILQVMRIDINPAVRQQASEAMWRLGNEEGLKDLVGLTLSRYPDDEMIGYLGLAWPRNTAVRQHVRAGLVGDWPEVTLVAARAMGMLGSDEGYVIAQKGAESADARQRVLGALALGAIGRSDAQDILRKLLSDADAGVRIAAATAILQLRA
jgi:HEAT repeat protein